jgi:tetraacyldisaccharide 4'-kinase
LRFQNQANQEEIGWATPSVFVFSGLARNASLQESVLKLGSDIVGYKEFGDHHWYTIAELEAIGRKADEAGARYLVTTDKDYVRLPKDWRFGQDLVVLGVDIDFGGDRDRWRQFLLNQLDTHSKC